jgi:hypothetical protein
VNTTISMWMGIAFVLLAVVAVLLQAWLWSPQYWDQRTRTTRAPPFWIGVHRVAGYLYGGIYLIMMWEMLPRLWEYQVELPARTVIHAVAALAIGVILATKIFILRFFRHFEETMPALGFGLLLCTVILASLSLPFVIRAHGATMDLDEASVARVRTVLAGLDLPADLGAERLTSERGFKRGRDVLVHKCTPCHDMRTILSRPRSGESWLDLNQRMAEKPQIGEPLTRSDVYYVTAYLVAVTPGIQESARKLRAVRLERAEAVEALDLELGAELTGGSGAPPTEEEESAEPEEETLDGAEEQTDETEPTADPRTDAAGSEAEAEAETEAPTRRERAQQRRRERQERRRAARRRLAAEVAALSYEEVRDVTRRVCLGCHGWDEIRDHGGDTMTGWHRVIRRMIVSEGAEIDQREARIALRYLARAYPPPR